MGFRVSGVGVQRAGEVIVQVQLKKIRDGRPSLTCVRADGSRTWSQLHPFFPIHDLTHYAVESVLGFTEAFFGLIASGWEIEDFAASGAAGRLPPEAIVAECAVGLLDLERATGHRMSGPEFTEALSHALAGQGRDAFRRVTEAELLQIRSLCAAVSAQWTQVPPGETLELSFVATTA